MIVYVCNDLTVIYNSKYLAYLIGILLLNKNNCTFVTLHKLRIHS